MEYEHLWIGRLFRNEEGSGYYMKSNAMELRDGELTEITLYKHADADDISCLGDDPENPTGIFIYLPGSAPHFVRHTGAHCAGCKCDIDPATLTRRSVEVLQSPIRVENHRGLIPVHTENHRGLAP